MHTLNNVIYKKVAILWRSIVDNKNVKSLMWDTYNRGLWIFDKETKKLYFEELIDVSELGKIFSGTENTCIIRSGREVV